MDRWVRLGLMPALALLMGLALLRLMPDGVATSPDTGGYFLMAAEAQTGGPFAITECHWPPGYPWLLALAGSVIDDDLHDVAALLNVCAMALTALLTAWVIYHYRSAGDGWSAALVILSVFLFTAAIGLRSRIVFSGWSEPLFLAAVTAGLYMAWRGRVAARNDGCSLFYLGWAMTFFVLSWSIRFIGAVAIGLGILLVAAEVWRQRRAGRSVRIGVAWPGALTALLLLSAVLSFNKIRFGRFLVNDHEGSGPPIWSSYADYFGTFLTYLVPGNNAHPLSAPTVWGLTLFLSIVVWYRLRRAVRRATPGGLARLLEAAPIEWTIWLVLYSSAILLLMTLLGVWGTNRFVTPILSAFLVLCGRLILQIRQATWRRATAALVCLVALAGVRAPYRVVRRHVDRASPWHLYDLGVRGTPEFRRLSAAIQPRSTLVWLGAREESRQQARILAAHFSSKPVYEVPYEAFTRFPAVDSPMLIASDLQRQPLIERVSERGEVLAVHDELGVRYLLMRPDLRTQSIAPLPLEHFPLVHQGCR